MICSKDPKDFKTCQATGQTSSTKIYKKRKERPPKSPKNRKFDEGKDELEISANPLINQNPLEARGGNQAGRAQRRRFDAERALLRAELLLLSRANHRNLVQLLGFCGERILVFEFILSTARSTTSNSRNGSLVAPHQRAVPPWPPPRFGSWL